MKSYEYEDEGGRSLCVLHHRLRCDECHYVSDLRDENQRYHKARREIERKYDEEYSIHSDEYSGGISDGLMIAMNIIDGLLENSY